MYRAERHNRRMKYAKLGFIMLLTLMIMANYTPLAVYSNARSSGAVFYVSPDGDDSGPGTMNAPWRTIQNAADTLAAGQTVLVREGVYEEFVSIRSSGSASEGFITFQAYPGERPVIDGSKLSIASGRNTLVEIRSANYIIFDGFEVRGLSSSSSSQFPAGIRVHYGGSNIHILNNDVHHIENHSSNGNAHGIHLYGNSVAALTDVRVSGNRVHHLKLGSSESLTLSGNIDGFLVENNVVHDNNNIGIDVAGFYGACSSPCRDQARNGVIAGNTVYNIDSSTNPAYGSGSYSAGGIYADGAADVVIERNHVYHSNFGIEIASENYGKSTSRITVRNNYVHHNDGAGIIMGGSGPDNGGASDNRIVNNTLIENDRRKQGYGEITLQENNTNNVIANNLIYTYAGKAMIHKSRTSGKGNIVDYNLYYRPDGENGASWRWEGKSYRTWDEYKRATGHDAHSIFTEPGLTDRQNHQIRPAPGSPAIDKANDAYADDVLYDYYGSARKQGAGVDIGAAEYVGGAVPGLPPGEPQGPGEEPQPGAPDGQPEPGDQPDEENPPSGGDFIIDGDFADWETIPALSTSHSNVRSIKSVIRNGELYVLVTGSLLADKGQLFLNTDGSGETGFQAPYWKESGADYLLENGILYKYSGRGGSNWGWTEVRSYKRIGKFAVNSSVMEASISLQDLGITESDTVHIGYVWNDSNDHKLPEAGSMPAVGKGGLAVPPPSEPEVPTIRIDGSPDEWSRVRALSAGDANPRILKAHNDADHLFLLLEGDRLEDKTQIYFKVQQPSAAYARSNWSSGAAHYLLENGRAYKYTGQGKDWSWESLANLKSTNGYIVQGNTVEAGISLSLLGLKQGDTVAIGVLLNDNRETQLPVSGEMPIYTIK